MQLMQWVTSSGRPGRPFLNGADFMDELPRLAPGTVLVEVGIVGINGFELIEAIARARYDLLLVALLTDPDMNSAVACLRRGAVDVVVRIHCAEALQEAVANAEKVLEIRRPMAEQFHKDGTALRRLTRRECQVLKCLASGMTSKSTSVELSLSARTVEFYRSSMIDKLKCGTSAAAIATLIRHDTFRNARANLGALTGVQVCHQA
jgi:two-component system response regulator FixJ